MLIVFLINKLTLGEDLPVKAAGTSQALRPVLRFWLDLNYLTLLLINFSASGTRLMTRGPFDFIRERVKIRRAAGAVGLKNAGKTRVFKSGYY